MLVAEVQGLPARPENGAIVTPEYTATNGTLAYAGTGAGAPQPEGGGMSMWIFALYGAIFVGMWFLLIRPQRKREKQMKELQASISTGDNVVTSGGLFGKVADIGEDCFIVEFGTNRGIRIPILKGDVLAVREPKMTPQVKED
ncbi:MAG: preprotein translocase subunit YajC [Defluviitaleaceae bacterium]|nr:preprotein translocase subunit YajC [Defluviitaleaceae bacterium]MCL2262233.1 preprotein translocase subunit YajC [Defluviitaleaceae bacterium]